MWPSLTRTFITTDITSHLLAISSLAVHCYVKPEKCLIKALILIGLLFAPFYKQQRELLASCSSVTPQQFAYSKLHTCSRFPPTRLKWAHPYNSTAAPYWATTDLIHIGLAAKLFAYLLVIGCWARAALGYTWCFAAAAVSCPVAVGGE